MSVGPDPVVVLDTGALLAVERRDRRLRALEDLAVRGRVRLLVPAGVVAQVWRDPARQVPVVRLLRRDAAVEVPLDRVASRRVGSLLTEHGTSDVVDGHVALLAQDAGAQVVTSDRGDLERLGVPADRLQDC